MGGGESCHGYEAHHLRPFLIPEDSWKHKLGVTGVQKHIERGHTVIPALIIDTFRVLHIMKTTQAKHLECCVILL